MSLTKEQISDAATKIISAKCPGYHVKWNPDEKAFPDDEPGMFELFGPDKIVHYRRRHIDEIMSLANIKTEITS